MTGRPTLAITSDHAGYELKTLLIGILEKYAESITDLGTKSALVSVDYPDYADLLANAVISRQAGIGIAICGSGIGMSIGVNRHAGIRAALCHDGLSAALARRHNDANILCLGARLIGIETAIDCVHHFLSTPFEGGRHSKRVEKLK